MTNPASQGRGGSPLSPLERFDMLWDFIADGEAERIYGCRIPNPMGGLDTLTLAATMEPSSTDDSLTTSRRIECMVGVHMLFDLEEINVVKRGKTLGISEAIRDIAGFVIQANQNK
ncbi:MAG TPA: hypothetical protein VLE69_03355 [Candidatus Saccharimonadales bacterium]|nr:hypothetical protein [Candidatus Saccharimonadales bacterium]